jgi:hypothetical protein
MNEYTQKPELERSSENMFLQLFNERILGSEAMKSKSIALAKQFQITELRAEIMRFIKEHSYSYFDVQVLDARTDLDLNKPLHGITIRNFELFIEKKNPRRYLISIFPNWTECRFYQLSPAGLRIEEHIYHERQKRT